MKIEKYFMVTYEYNIYKSKNTRFIDLILAECCFTWNHALALQRRYYRMFGKHISYNRMSAHFNKRIKRTLLHSQTRQEILKRLDESYRRFFKKSSKRPPKFKKASYFSSFVFTQGGFKLNGNEFTINNIGKRFRFSYSRPYEGNVKQIRIKRLNNGRYALYITTDHSLTNTYGKTHDGASVGIDFGLKTYMTTSDGHRYQSPRFFKQHEKELKQADKRLSKAKKGSSNRKRRKFEKNQIEQKIVNQRNDYQWKLAHELCQAYDYIYIEDLNLDGMKRMWGKKISDLSHASFIQKLEHVATKYGVTVHKIDRFYPSSKTCTCGYVNKELSLRDRQWTCPVCGETHDRDLLAANNILRRGIYELESGSKTLRSRRASHASI